jgi:hypothetical protein
MADEMPVNEGTPIVDPAQLMQTIANLQAQLDNQRRTIEQMNQPVARRGNKVIEDIERYDGKDSLKLEAFLTHYELKIALDGGLIGAPSAQYAYGYSRLTDRAANIMKPLMNEVRTNPEVATPEKFVEQMRTYFGDPYQSHKALTKLKTMKQGNKNINTHITNFEEQLVLANANVFPDAMKIQLLDDSLNDLLRQQTTNLPIEDYAYATYCQRLVGIEWIGSRLTKPR